MFHGNTKVYAITSPTQAGPTIMNIHKLELKSWIAEAGRRHKLQRGFHPASRFQLLDTYPLHALQIEP